MADPHSLWRGFYRDDAIVGEADSGRGASVFAFFGSEAGSHASMLAGSPAVV